MSRFVWTCFLCRTGATEIFDLGKLVQFYQAEPVDWRNYLYRTSMKKCILKVLNTSHHAPIYKNLRKYDIS